MNIIKFIQALRPVNLLMTVLILFSVRYGILRHENIHPNWFPLYVIALIFLMCFGYLINDYFDVETDQINKPGKNIFAGNNTLQPKAFIVASLAIGIIIPIIGFLQHYQWVGLLSMYLFAALILFLYARYLKNTVFIGNLLIAVLSALSIMVPCYIKLSGISISTMSLNRLAIYTLFAFLITLVREIAKDAEDIEGDKKAGIRTIATLGGTKTSIYFLSVLMVICLILLFGTCYYFFALRVNLPNAISFFVLAICGFFPFFKIIRATDKKHFSQASSYLKLWMLIGIISMWI